MQLPSELTDAQHAAIIACLRIAAARGRAIRLERERQQKTESPSNLAGAGDSVTVHNGTPLLPKGNTDAN